MALKKFSNAVPTPVFKIMLTGFYDVGKTYSVYKDTTKKMVIIDTEGRFANYANVQGFEHLVSNAIVYSGKEIDTLEKIYQIIKDVRDDDGKTIQVLFIDSMTVLYNKILTKVNKLQKDKAKSKGYAETMSSVGKDGFGAVKLDWQTLLSELYGLPVQLVFTSQDKTSVDGVVPMLDVNTLALPDLALRLTRDKSNSKSKPVAEVIKGGSSELQVGQRLTDFSMEKLWKILKVNPTNVEQKPVETKPVSNSVELKVNSDVDLNLAIVKTTLNALNTKQACTDYLEELKKNEAYPESVLARGGAVSKLVGERWSQLAE